MFEPPAGRGDVLRRRESGAHRGGFGAPGAVPATRSARAIPPAPVAARETAREFRRSPGYPLLQAPHIQPARSSARCPRRQRGQARTLVNEFASDTPGAPRGKPRAAMLAFAGPLVKSRAGLRTAARNAAPDATIPPWLGENRPVRQLQRKVSRRMNAANPYAPPRPNVSDCPGRRRTRACQPSVSASAPRSSTRSSSCAGHLPAHCPVGIAGYGDGRQRFRVWAILMGWLFILCQLHHLAGHHHRLRRAQRADDREEMARHQGGAHATARRRRSGASSGCAMSSTGLLRHHAALLAHRRAVHLRRRAPVPSRQDRRHDRRHGLSATGWHSRRARHGRRGRNARRHPAGAAAGRADRALLRVRARLADPAR